MKDQPSIRDLAIATAMKSTAAGTRGTTIRSECKNPITSGHDAHCWYFRSSCADLIRASATGQVLLHSLGRFNNELDHRVKPGDDEREEV